jgi:MFS family permease
MESAPTPIDYESTPAAPSAPASGFAFMLRALRYRNYRLVFVGQGLSLIGTWLTTTATSWLVLRLATKANAQVGVQVIAAATVLGIVRFAAQIPMSVLAPAAGVLIDRWNRHTVLVATQALSMIQSILLAWLTFSGRINVGQIIGLSVFQGLINAFDAPARQAFVVELVEDRADLPNAIALNSSMFNGARLLGPAIGGIMIARLGEGWCFAIDGISYLAVLIALLMMKLPPRVSQLRQHNAWRELRDGFAYAVGFAPVRALLLLAGLISLTVGAYQTLVPIFADRIAPNHDRGAAIFGFLGAAIGVGSLAGAIFLASRRTVVGLGKLIAIGAAVAGVAMAAFAATQSLPFMLVSCVFGGFGMIITFAASNTLLQTIVDDEMRGRLMSFFIVAVMGAAPVGSLIAGWLADRVGEPLTVILCGVISVIGSILFMIKLPALRSLVRPIYVKKGIIPEVATGLAAAAVSEES